MGNWEKNLRKVEKHLHPISNRSIPNGKNRQASIRITAVSNGQVVVLGATTYTFVTALGTPGAGLVDVKIQGTVQDSVKKLAQAIRGETDAVNIAYNSQAANASASAWWTSQKFSIGASAIAATGGTSVGSLFLRETADDSIAAITFTSDTTNTLVAFTRVYFTQYVCDGNASPAANSVAGGLHMVIPVGRFATMRCDTSVICVSAMSVGLNGKNVEMDILYSLDETTFVQMSEGFKIARDTTVTAQQYAIAQQRPPLGAGVYVRMRSDDTSASDTVNFSVDVHCYPLGL